MAKTSTAQQRHFLNNADAHQKEIVRLIQEVARTRGVDRVWSDWVEISAIALARTDMAQFEAREKRYLEVVAQYERPELERLVQAFSHLVMAYDERVQTGDFGDLLGSTFMMMNMGNAGSGQFFTPYEVSRLMSGLILGSGQGLTDKVQARQFIRVMEPACGAGGMLIATAHAMHDAGLNYQQCMHATAIDIDRRCVHMTFIQLALLHVPALVIHGNGLTGETREQWYTPAHIMGGWRARLRRRNAEESTRAVSTDDAAAVAPISVASEEPLQKLPQVAAQLAKLGQMSLF